jgi:hypothetical protein
MRTILFCSELRTLELVDHPFDAWRTFRWQSRWHSWAAQIQTIARRKCDLCGRSRVRAKRAPALAAAGGLHTLTSH